MAPNSSSPDPLADVGVDVDTINDALTPHDWGRKTWKSAFLVAFARTRNVSQSARAAGVSRTYAEDERKDDPVFGEACREAFQVGADLLETVALVRATTGVPVRRVRRKRDADGRVFEEVEDETTHVSDTLLLAMLRAAKPGVYRERYDFRHVGPDDGPVQIEVGPRRRTAERIAELMEIAVQMGVPLPQAALPAPSDAA